MSHEALSPQQFFHGTTADLKPGEHILPAKDVGKGRGRSVWLATHPDSAQGWGESRAMRDGNFTVGEDGWETKPSVPVHVYEVEPHDLKQDRNGYHKAAKATVKRRVKP